MKRFLAFAYGVVCYAIFLGVFVYLIAFLADVGVSKTVSSGSVPAGPSTTALAIDIALIALFGLQHSIMARRGFKRTLTRLLPVAIERSTYVLATNLVLILLFVCWRPLPRTIWQAQNPALVDGLYLLCALGWLLALISTFLTNHFDLFGLRQIYLNLIRKMYTPVAFKEHFFYRWVRHPMMLGLLIAFWAAPLMSASHLLFSIGMSLYVLVGIHFEETALRLELGSAYQQYMARTVRVLPFY